MEQELSSVEEKLRHKENDLAALQKRNQVGSRRLGTSTEILYHVLLYIPVPFLQVQKTAALRVFKILFR
jgi:hypothetical protein